MNRWITLVVVAVLCLVGCQDKAEPGLKDCQQLHSQGKLTEALAACQKAVSADPNTKSGKAASKQVQDLKAAIAKEQADKKAAAEKAAQQAKRKSLLASTNPTDWKTLIKDSPGTDEAKLAEEKLGKHESVCLDRSRWNPTLAIKRLGDRSGQAAMMSNMSDALAAHTAVGLGDACKKETERLEGEAKEIKGHAVRPGEAAIQKELAMDRQKLADMNKSWTKAFYGYDGDLAPYVALQRASERLADTVLKHDTAEMMKCIDLAKGSK